MGCTFEHINIFLENYTKNVLPIFVSKYKDQIFNMIIFETKL